MKQQTPKEPRDNRTLVDQRISEMIKERKETQRKIEEAIQQLRDLAEMTRKNNEKNNH